MLRILRRAAGQDDIPIITQTGLRSGVEDRGREAAKAAGKGASIEEMRAVGPAPRPNDDRSSRWVS